MEERKMNVLVLGASGAGKSTLIKSILGVDVETGVSEGNTKGIEVYESSTWPLRCIDTMGFEYNFFEQLKTINQIKKYTKKEVKNDFDDSGIDAVWYCVEGTSRRTFSHNINLMNKAVKGWKNIPVFVVITKSYSEIDIKENVEAVKEAFSKVKNINLKGIIPVVALEYDITDEIKVVPSGLEELCIKTLECLDEAAMISKENKDRMVLEQKRVNANAITVGATTSAVVVAAVPIPFADSLILVPIETTLTKLIFKVYGVDYSGDLVVTIVGSSAITTVAKGIISTLKGVPIAGPVLNGTVAGVIVFALGEAVIALSEQIYKGKIDPNKLNDIADFINDKIKDNVIIDATISYFEKNDSKLNNKTSKEIFNDIVKSVKKKKK